MSLRSSTAAKSGTTPTGRQKRSYRKRADKERTTLAEFESTKYVEVAQDLHLRDDPHEAILIEYLRQQLGTNADAVTISDTATQEQEQFLNCTWKALLACWQPGKTCGVDVYMHFVASKLFKAKGVIGILFSVEGDAYNATLPSLLEREDITFSYDMSNRNDIVPNIVEQHEDGINMSKDVMLLLEAEEPPKRGRKGSKRKDYVQEPNEPASFAPLCTDRGMPVCMEPMDVSVVTHELLTSTISYLDNPICSLRFRVQSEYATLDEKLSYICERDIDHTSAVFVVLRSSDMHPVAVEFYALQKDLKLIMNNVICRVGQELSKLGKL